MPEDAQVLSILQRAYTKDLQRLHMICQHVCGQRRAGARIDPRPSHVRERKPRMSTPLLVYVDNGCSQLVCARGSRTVMRAQARVRRNYPSREFM